MEWPELIDAAVRADWPSPEKQEFVKNGLIFLQNFFGDDVLKVAFESYHPYFAETINLAPWNLQRYAEFGHRINVLRAVPNAYRRLKQLRNASLKFPDRGSIENFFGFFSEVEIAYPFVAGGITTEFIQETKTRTPDLRVKIDDRWLNKEFKLEFIR